MLISQNLSMRNIEKFIFGYFIKINVWAKSVNTYNGTREICPNIEKTMYFVNLFKNKIKY